MVLYREFLLDLTSSTEAVHCYVPADGRFLCDKAAALEGKAKQTSCIIVCCDENRNRNEVRLGAEE